MMWPTGFSSRTRAAHSSAAFGRREATFGVGPSVCGDFPSSSVRGDRLRRGDDALIKLYVLRDDEVCAVAAHGGLARAPPHLAAQVFRGEQACRARAHLLDVADFCEAAGPAVVNDFGDAAAARSDDGNLAGH